MSCLNQAHKNCVGCGACMKMCPMLDLYCDTPKALLNDMVAGEKIEDVAYSCTLCGLCTQVCDFDVNLKSVFLEARQNTMLSNPPRKHYVVKFHQKNSFSKVFSTGVTDSHKKMFFPGCALVAGKPDIIGRIYKDLRDMDSDTGIMLNCCGNPTQIIGDTNQFRKYTNHLNDLFNDMKVEEVIVACPNCYNTLKETSNLKVTTLWEILDSEKSLKKVDYKVTIHDPCPTRNHDDIHGAIRSILKKMDVDIVESSYSCSNTLCCGSGGMVMVTNPEVAKRQREIRLSSLNETIITYCQECVESLSNSHHEVLHILDLIYDTKNIKYDILKKWLNRYLVKRRIK